MSPIRYTPVVALTLTLAACTPSTPTPVAPTVASVMVTGPSNNSLKIGEVTTLTSSAKDSSGNAITGKTFTWTSSDPNIASVDANGAVTAKRFGSVTITSSTGGFSGSSSSLKTFGLEAVGGTYTVVGSANTGTALMFRFRNADSGGSSDASVSFSLVGPAGWNGGKGITFSRSLDGKSNDLLRAADIAPVAGAYTLSTSVGGTAYNTGFTLTDPAQTLNGPATLTLSSATASSVTATWPAVTGATRYAFEVYNDTDKKTELNTVFYKSTPGGTVDGLNLDKAKTYYFRVFSYNTVVCCTENFGDIYPIQFNVASNQVKITLP